MRWRAGIKWTTEVTEWMLKDLVKRYECGQKYIGPGAKWESLEVSGRGLTPGVDSRFCYNDDDSENVTREYTAAHKQ